MAVNLIGAQLLPSGHNRTGSFDLCFVFVFSLYLVFVGYSLILISTQFVLPLLVVCVANAAIYFKLKVSDVDVDH